MTADKAAESSLRAHREYLEAVLEGSPAAIMVTHIESGEIRFANRIARTMLRLDHDGGQLPSAHDLWADKAERQRLLEQLERSGAASGEVRLRGRGGAIFDASVHWQYNPGSSDEVLCWCMDISERKQEQQRLQDQELILQRIVDHLPVALFCKDVNDSFRYTMANRESELYFRTLSEDVIGRTDFELFPTSVALRFRQQDLAIAETGKPLEITEEQFESASGEPLFGHYIKIAIPDRDGKPALIVGICENITERREAEKALHASERRFHELAEHAPVGIFLTDPRGACIYVNEQWQKTSGLDQRDAAGSGWLTAVHADDRRSVADAWLAFVDGGTPFMLEFRFQATPEEEVWVASNAVPFRNEAGQIVGFLGTTTDITPRKRFETQLQESRDEAHRANQAKTEFLSRMSHELRTPLNAVLGFGQLLQMSSEELSESQNEGVEQILAGGEHLLQLIDEVLDYSRIDTGHMTLGIQRIDTAEPIERALSLVRGMAERSGISLLAPSSPPPAVVADPRRLQQILVNLLSNAVKYNREGGEVKVLHRQMDDGLIRLAVQDTGIGIRKQDEARLFEPFERIVHPDKVVEGTGIGLSICKRLAELMGGRVGFESEYGTGSTFWVDLPAAEMQDEESDWLFGTFDTIVDAANFEGLRILYVEDHLASIRFMSEVTRRIKDCELLTATNGTDGISLAKSARPDVILMDINMPGINGYETLAILRHDDRTADIPAIALSANASAETIESARAAGFLSFLPKPLRIGQLFEALASARHAPAAFKSTD